MLRPTLLHSALPRPTLPPPHPTPPHKTTAPAPQAVLNQAQVESLRSDDAISRLFNALSDRYPELVAPLITERDLYLSCKCTPLLMLCCFGHPYMHAHAPMLAPAYNHWLRWPCYCCVTPYYLPRVPETVKGGQRDARGCRLRGQGPPAGYCVCAKTR